MVVAGNDGGRVQLHRGFNELIAVGIFANAQGTGFSKAGELNKEASRPYKGWEASYYGGEALNERDSCSPSLTS